jgi:hypothetical protein
MKKTKTGMASFILLAIILSACQDLPDIRRPTYIPRSTWLTQWLAEPLCELPCYRGIIPGKTTLEDAKKIVKEIPEVTDVEVVYPDDNQYFEYGVITWSYEATNKESGRIETYSNSLVISDIALHNASRFPIHDAVEMYGYPTHVWIGLCHGVFPEECPVYLVYMNKGLMYYLAYQKVNWINDSISLSENQNIEEIYFFPAGFEEFCEVFPTCEDILLDWNGFVDYSLE